MERSTIKLLKKRGCNHTEIAKALGRDRKTIRRVLREPANQQQQRSARGSIVAPYESQIRSWLEEGLPVNVMLQKARELASNPYAGGRTAFYEGVRRIRESLVREEQPVIWRFEGLPGEYLQVDWGEKSKMRFTEFSPEKRYCFVARLKYSRWLYVEWQRDMRFETLLRCLLRCFEALEGVPWVLRFDNMSTIVEPRQRKKADGSPNWRAAFIQFASELGFHPELCDVAAPNQKGSVENGVKFVKSSFLPGRHFRDDDDLARQSVQWQQRVNSEPCQAHGQLPEDLLQEERQSFEALHTTAQEYGILHQLPASLESVVRLETNRYSVPEQLMGLVLDVRVASKQVRVFHQAQLVALHPRCFGRNQWIRQLEHYSKTFERKPKAKVRGSPKRR